MGVRSRLRAVVLVALLADCAALAVAAPRATVASRSPGTVMMAKKTSWSIGNARKKAKKAKVATPTVSRKARSTDGSPSALVRKSA